MANYIQTSIKLKMETKERLRALKIHPNQSFDEVIIILMDNQKVKR